VGQRGRLVLYLATYSCGNERRTEQISERLCCLSGNCRNVTNNVCVIESGLPATELRDRIREHLEDGEEVVVFLLAGHAAWHGVDTETEDWLLAHL
jgi:hypothetical protein